MNLKITSFVTGTLFHDEIGREVIKKIQTDYRGTVVDIPTLTGSGEGPLKGSRPIYRFLVGKTIHDFLEGQNISPHTLAQGEIALRNWSSHYDENPNSFFEDYGLVVFPIEGNNPNLWKHLRDQVGANFKGVDVKLPFVVEGIPSKLNIGSSHDSSRIDLGELTMVYNHHSLDKPGAYKFSSDDSGLVERGLPNKLGNGDRTLYVGESGVGRLYRYGNLNLYARLDNLDDSYGYCRVHYAKNFSTSNSNQALEELSDLALSQKQEIDRRLIDARKLILTGNI